MSGYCYACSTRARLVAVSGSICALLVHFPCCSFVKLRTSGLFCYRTQSSQMMNALPSRVCLHRSFFWANVKGQREGPTAAQKCCRSLVSTLPHQRSASHSVAYTGRTRRMPWPTKVERPSLVHAERDACTLRVGFCRASSTTAQNCTNWSYLQPGTLNDVPDGSQDAALAAPSSGDAVCLSLLRSDGRLQSL